MKQETISELLERIDWSSNNYFKTIVMVIIAVITNFLDYTQVTPILVKALVVAMIIDTFLGARVAAKLTKEYDSKELRSGIYEKGLYLAVFLGLAYILKGLDIKHEYIPKTLFSILIITETISFLNHFVSLRTKKVSKEIDFVTMFVRVIKVALKNIATKMISAVAGVEKSEKEKGNEHTE